MESVTNSENLIILTNKKYISHHQTVICELLMYLNCEMQ